MEKPTKEIVLKKETKGLKRFKYGSRLLTDFDVVWYEKGKKIEVSQPFVMFYNSKDQCAFQVMGSSPQRFILLSDIDQSPWSS